MILNRSSSHGAADTARPAAMWCWRCCRAVVQDELRLEFYETVKKKGYVRMHTNLGDLNIELHCDMVLPPVRLLRRGRGASGREEGRETHRQTMHDTCIQEHSIEEIRKRHRERESTETRKRAAIDGGLVASARRERACAAVFVMVGTQTPMTCENFLVHCKTG